MTCPKCGSDNVTLQIVQTGGKTQNKHGGCLWLLGTYNLYVWFMAINRKA